MVTLRVRFRLTQSVQAPSHNHPSAMGLAEVIKHFPPVIPFEVGHSHVVKAFLQCGKLY